jgi:hypothetical protein
VLAGIRDELNKVGSLADHAHLQSAVLLPALAHARTQQSITPQEHAVLEATIRAGIVKSSDLESAMPRLNANQRSYQIRKLIEAGMLRPLRPGARQYSLGFTNNTLLRGVIHALRQQGFIPEALDRA